jgi:hypothetical protein
MFSWLIFHLYVVTTQLHLHISLSVYDIPDIVVVIMISMTEVSTNKETTEPGILSG